MTTCADEVPEPETGEATPVCTGCALPVPPDEDFCPKCGAPVGVAASTLPVRGLFAKRPRRGKPPLLLAFVVLLLVAVLALLLNR